MRTVLLPLLLALTVLPAPAFAASIDSTRTTAVATDSAPPRPTRWALALSGGVARGIAHIGVLQALEEQGLRPDLVVGTSMGSLIGALWSSGRSSTELRELFRDVDVQSLFDPLPPGFTWRDHVVPRPWFTLLGRGGFMTLPPGMIEDAFLNDLLARHLLVSDGIAQGDFDRLPIPWRAVATEMATLGQVVIDRGSVAHAVRSSISIPMVFPGVWSRGQLLVDGGLSSHLPMIAARSDSADHVLGIDVASPLPPFGARTSAVRVLAATFQLVSQRGRTDARPDRDHVLWLRMPGASPADFRLVDTLVARGYRESRDTIATLARAWSLPRRAPPGPIPALPPIADITWVRHDGRPVRGATAASEAFYPRPRGPFIPDQLAPALARVHGSDLFVAAWPRFRSGPDSTRVTLEVQEHEPLGLAGSLAYDTDDGARVHADLVARPMVGDRPALARLGGFYRRFARAGFVSIEPRSLARGATGLFVRGGARRSETRVFERDARFRLERTERVEVTVGTQLRLPTSDVVQAGAGIGRVWTGNGLREGPLAALRMETRGRRPRHLDLAALGGRDGYATVRGGMTFVQPHPWATLQPSVQLGWASDGAPIDEWRGLGGPAGMAGLRRGEWLGRRSIAVELRAVRHVVTGMELHATLQAGHVDHAIGRRDLSGRVRVAAGLGFHAAVPFGPFHLDTGLTEGGHARVFASLGQEF